MAGSTLGPTTSYGESIGAGEILEVYVAEDESFNGRYTVRSGGHIIFPRIGRVVVAGMSSPGAESAIKRALESTQLKTASVMVERRASKDPVSAEEVTVFLSGNVRTAGRRSVRFVAGRRPTLYQAIVEAGGLVRFADDSHVLLTRQSPGGEPEMMKIDIARIKRGTVPDVQLADGDMVFVPEKTFGW